MWRIHSRSTQKEIDVTITNPMTKNSSKISAEFNNEGVIHKIFRLVCCLAYLGLLLLQLQPLK